MLFMAAAAPPVASMSRSSLNDRLVKEPLAHEHFIPQSLSEGRLVEAGAMELFQLYRREYAVVDDLRGQPLTRMESHTVSLQLWLLLGIMVYWLYVHQQRLGTWRPAR
jgi:hypothetical protein